jgi:hypothetical protein
MAFLSIAVVPTQALDSSPHRESMQIVIRHLNGKTFAVEVEPEDSIYRVKRKIQQLKGVTHNCVHLRCYIDGSYDPLFDLWSPC